MLNVLVNYTQRSKRQITRASHLLGAPPGCRIELPWHRSPRLHRSPQPPVLLVLFSLQRWGGTKSLPRFLHAPGRDGTWHEDAQGLPRAHRGGLFQSGTGFQPEFVHPTLLLPSPVPTTAPVAAAPVAPTRWLRRRLPPVRPRPRRRRRAELAVGIVGGVVVHCSSSK